MSLFTKSLKDIGINDVIAFCGEGIEEGIRIEYKEDWTDNKKLAREIASFANTYGGLLLIGIAERDRKPILPLTGIDLEEGIDEKITSISFKGINPPVFPEIKICEMKDNPRKAVIVIRVYESDDTPHRVEQDTKVYIRVSSQKEPVLAPFEEIEWMMNRRKKALDNSDRLLSRARKRFFEKYKKTGPDPQPGQRQVGIGTLSGLRPPEYKVPPTRGILIIPLYPHQEIIMYLDLVSVINRSVASNFPAYRISHRDYISTQDSIIYCTSGQEISHTEINSFGLVFHKEDFSLDEHNYHGDKSLIDIDTTLGMIYSILSFALNFYKNVGFWGSIKIDLTFDQILMRKLSFGHTDQKFSKNQFDNQIIVERKTTVFELVDNIDETVIDIFKEFLWSFGVKSDPKTNFPEILKRAITRII